MLHSLLDVVSVIHSEYMANNKKGNVRAVMEFYEGYGLFCSIFLAFENGIKQTNFCLIFIFFFMFGLDVLYWGLRQVASTNGKIPWGFLLSQTGDPKNLL